MSLDEFTKQKQTFKEIVHFSSNALLASYFSVLQNRKV